MRDETTGGRTTSSPNAAPFARTLDAAAAVAAWSRIADPAVRGAVAGSLGDLMAGNRRFVAGTPAHRDLHGERAALVSGQSPVAAIVACSDSRIAIEDTFDAPLGTLFATKTAGSAIDSAVLGSLEFAVASLGVRLIVVLGHEKCGAVRAAMDGDAHSGALGALVAQLRAHISGAHGHEAAVRACAVATGRALLTESPALGAAFDRGALAVVPAFYWLGNGRVDLIG